jgi:hypothetical protein
VATEGTLELHVSGGAAIVTPKASFTTTLSDVVVPALIEFVDGVTLMVAGICADPVTVSAAVPVLPPLAAVIVVLPPPLAVMLPVEEMVATPVLELVHVTTRAIALPTESFTSAVACVVRFTAMFELTRLTVIDATLGGSTAGVTVSTAVPLTLPLVALMVVVPVASVTIAPACDTVATAGLELVQVI